MPISNENRVRVEFFSKITPTPRGPSSGRRRERRLLEFGGQRQDFGLLGRGQVVVAQEVPTVMLLALSVSSACRRRRIEDRGQRGQESVGLLVGQDQRRRQPNHVGLRGVHQVARLAGGGLDGGGDGLR